MTLDNPSFNPIHSSRLGLQWSMNITFLNHGINASRLCPTGHEAPSTGIRSEPRGPWLFHRWKRTHILQLFCLKQCILSNAPIQLDWQTWLVHTFSTKFSLSLSEFRGIYHTQKPSETNAVRWAISQFDDTVAQWVVRIAWGQRLLPAFHMDGPGHCLPLIRTWPVDLRGQCTFWWQGAK